MEENSAMIGVKREEEIELDLALSIGGGFKNLNRTKNEPEVQKTGGYDTDLQIDFESKREIEALRRLGSKRKRQEKQQKKRTCNNGGDYGVGLNNRVWLKSPELEHELDVKVQDCKKIKVEKEEEEEIGGPRSNYNNMGMKNGNLNFTVQQNGVHMNNNNNNNNNNQNVAGFNSTVCPVMYPYPPVQYVQFANGFRYPCLNVVPCWAAAGGGAGNEQNMVQSVVGRIFRPFGSGHDPGQNNMGNEYGSDQDSRKAGSNGSPVCSSSAVSGYRSSSHEGGGSSDTRSHSSHSLPEQCKLQDSIATEAKGQSEHSASSHLRETAQVYDETTNCSAYCGKPKTSSNNAQRSPSSMGQKIPSKAVDCSQAKPKDEAATELPTENLSPPVAKESKKDMGKPPKPQTHNQNQKTPPLPHMPCVSATGNGPHGKTIHGFLYRYTKTEVSIICVCHGTSFSPAEFVQHAGGTDVSHPLKHITVVPSAF